MLEQELSIASLGGAIGGVSRLFIGHHNSDTGTFVRPLIGTIDELEIFNRPLSQSEIQSVFLAGAAGKCKFRVGDTVRLDGSRSADADADPLTYRWTLLAKPTGSTAALDDASAAQPTFVADLQGTYLVQLIVNDGAADSSPSEISLVVLEGNRPSIALDDVYSVKLGETLAVPPPGVVGNDFDPDGNSLTAAKIADPVNGTLGFNNNGSFDYTPRSGLFEPGATGHALIGTTFMPGQPKSIDINAQTNRIYVTNLFANSLAVIDGANGKVIALPNANSYIEDVVVNPVTNRIYMTSTRQSNYIESTLNNFNGVKVIDGATNAVIAGIPIGPVFPPDFLSIGHQSQHLAINPITNRIYVANVRDNSVSVIDGATNTLIVTVPVGREPRQIRVDEKLNRVYALSTLDANVTVLDGETNSALVAIPVGGDPRFMFIDADLARLYVVNFGSNNLTVIDETTNAVFDTVAVGAQPSAIALHPALDRLYVTNAGGDSITVIDRDSRAVLGTIPVGASPQSVTVNPFSNKVYVANAGANTVSVIDADTGTVTATVPVGGDPRSILVNPMTDRVYTLDAASHTVSVVHVGDRFTYKVNDGTLDSNAATVTIVIEPPAVPPVAGSDRYQVTQ